MHICGKCVIVDFLVHQVLLGLVFLLMDQLRERLGPKHLFHSLPPSGIVDPSMYFELSVADFRGAHPRLHVGLGHGENICDGFVVGQVLSGGGLRGRF